MGLGGEWGGQGDGKAKYANSTPRLNRTVPPLDRPKELVGRQALNAIVREEKRNSDQIASEPQPTETDSPSGEAESSVMLGRWNKFKQNLGPLPSELDLNDVFELPLGGPERNIEIPRETK